MQSKQIKETPNISPKGSKNLFKQKTFLIYNRPEIFIDKGAGFQFKTIGAEMLKILFILQALTGSTTLRIRREEENFFHFHFLKGNGG